jgi:hypothetical protein
MEDFIKWRRLPLELVREIIYFKYSSDPLRILKNGFGDLVKPKHIKKRFLNEYFLIYYRNFFFYKTYNKDTDFTYTQFNDKTICMMLDIAIKKLIITPVIINHCILFSPRYLYKMLYHPEYGRKLYHSFICNNNINLIELCTHININININSSKKIIFDFLLKKNSTAVIKRILKQKDNILEKIEPEIFDKIVINKNIIKYRDYCRNNGTCYNDQKIINILITRDKIDLLFEYIKMRDYNKFTIMKYIDEYYNSKNQLYNGREPRLFDDELKEKFHKILELKDGLYNDIVAYFKRERDTVYGCLYEYIYLLTEERRQYA